MVLLRQPKTLRANFRGLDRETIRRSLSHGSCSPVPSVERGRSRYGTRSSLQTFTDPLQCDRTKPCSACCARGHPKECEFVVGEGNDYSPIQQSYEIRKLRAENQKLKERLQQARLTGSGEDNEDDESSDRKSSKTSRATASRQRRFKTGERVDNLYFGTPGLANIVADVSIAMYPPPARSSLINVAVCQPPDRESILDTRRAERSRHVRSPRWLAVSLSYASRRQFIVGSRTNAVGPERRHDLRKPGHVSAPRSILLLPSHSRRSHSKRG